MGDIRFYLNLFKMENTDFTGPFLDGEVDMASYNPTGVGNEEIYNEEG
jgi:hypothetical protein